MKTDIKQRVGEVELNAFAYTMESKILNRNPKLRKNKKHTYLTMLPCCISFKREISLMAVLGTPSSSCSNRIFFKAMVSLVARSRAL
uniref:Cell division control protein 2 homolog n=1 Tax=Rhizophora mucronata TaxID=61149 RepID=A0A2P2M2Y8_RHIMU